jgi:hypothetical protein
MIRTQIQLTEQQAELLKAAAARRGVSMAELVRQSIDHLLERTGVPSPKELRRKAAAAAGRFRSAQGDVSTRHDDHLADALKK